jgi:hypothetical protein
MAEDRVLNSIKETAPPGQPFPGHSFQQYIRRTMSKGELTVFHYFRMRRRGTTRHRPGATAIPVGAEQHLGKGNNTARLAFAGLIEQGVVADGSRLHFCPLRLESSEAFNGPIRAGKRARG